MCYSRQCSICPERLTGSIEHILLFCSALKDVRKQLLMNLHKNTNFCDKSKQIIQLYFTRATSSQVQLVVDPSVLPEVINEIQKGNNNNVIEELFRFSRNWCFSMHKQRLKLQGKWTNS